MAGLPIRSHYPGHPVEDLRFRPDDLTAHDLIVDGVNFLALPETPCTYDVVTFDPPYIAPGGRKTSTIPGFNSAYGLGYTPKTPRQLQNDLINPGLTECARVVRKGGVILVKCMAYISSGDLQNGPKWTIDHAESIGLRQVDEFVHLGTEGPQPAHKRQVHARRTYSTLLVFRKPKRG